MVGVQYIPTDHCFVKNTGRGLVRFVFNQKNLSFQQLKVRYNYGYGND